MPKYSNMHMVTPTIYMLQPKYPDTTTQSTKLSTHFDLPNTQGAPPLMMHATNPLDPKTS